MPEPTWNAPWDGERVARWVRNAPALERQLAPVEAVLLAAAGLEPGEHVLDVGCGTGPTTRTAAAMVGPSGSATGLDVAGPMLEAAAAMPPPAGAAPLDWIQADATTWAPAAGSYDAVISRFGVMFFSEPPDAFANLATATRPGGRLAIATWARRERSEMFSLPLDAALAVLRARGQAPEEPPPDSGPFSLHDPDALADLLVGAGWQAPHSEVHELLLPLGGGLPPAEAAPSALEIGPVRILLEGADDDTRAAVVDAVAEALAGHVDAEGDAVVTGTVLITTAQR